MLSLAESVKIYYSNSAINSILIGIEDIKKEFENETQTINKKIYRVCD